MLVGLTGSIVDFLVNLDFISGGGGWWRLLACAVN